MSDKISKVTTTVPYSKFVLTKEQKEELTTQQLEELMKYFGSNRA